MWKAMKIPKLAIWLLLAAAMKLVVVEAKAKAPSISMAKPGCNDTCGKVTIPFPFGIGAGCFLDPWFEIECRPSPTNNSKGSIPKPFFSKLSNIELMEVKIELIESVIIVRLPPLKLCSGSEPDNTTQSQQPQSSINLTGSPYSFSATGNVFLMAGCPGSAVLVNQRSSIVAGCATICDSDNNAISTGSCYGVHCCRTALSSDQGDLQFYQIDFSSQNCLVATLTAENSVAWLSSSDLMSSVPVALKWRLPHNVKPGDNDDGAICSVDESGFHHCTCGLSYSGNPYVGCQAPEGCEGCRGYCYSNSSDVAATESPTKYYCSPSLDLVPIVGLGILCMLLLLGCLVGCSYGLYRFIKRRIEMKRRAKFFKCNGGLLLQQQLSSNEGVVERTKIFTISELNKATNNFNRNRILGQGGQGTVYKGMLKDGSIVAVKKSKLVDESQLEQFINEVVILSRISHRHVVKLFGCCLETEVPLLVYEFIPNGTLYEHIHDPDEDFFISWEMRLKIAADSAGAIAYLHSSSSIPIYHRDIKSSNILLDEKHRGKVSDFGSSKTIAIDQTHLTTVVQGTMGYLDPEYFQSYQFTEKSDVYSFGVVLLELLTSKKPILRDASTVEQKNLVTEFQFLTQNSRMSEILDPEIVKQAKEDELISVAELAKRCVSWSGNQRPTMKEVAMTLERIMKSPAQVSAWYRQQEDIPIQYAAYDEFDMTDISGEEFMWSTGPSGPSYTDENPLLPDTI